MPIAMPAKSRPPITPREATYPRTTESTRARGARFLLLCAQETRPAVLIIFLARFLVAGTAGLTSVTAAPSTLILGSLVWIASVAFSYLYNGVTDVREDRANGSRRPIAHGNLSVVHARRAAWALAAFALTGAATLGPVMFVVTLGMIALGYAYSSPRLSLKSRTPDTIAVVAAAGGLTYFAGWLAGAAPLTADLVVLAVAMTLWMGLVGAVAKDFSDTRGDAKHGRRNWTVLWGGRVTAFIVSVSAVAIGAALLASAVAFGLPDLLAPAGVVLAGAVALAAAALTARPGDSRSRRRLPYRIFMITQHVAHLVTLAQPAV
ncbi:UbiA family prenyltransferase [Streptomyces chryseus]|nr:UbiA family prenyltransferase [Streptomyces chryseus]